MSAAINPKATGMPAVIKQAHLRCTVYNERCLTGGPLYNQKKRGPIAYAMNVGRLKIPKTHNTAIFIEPL